MPPFIMKEGDTRPTYIVQLLENFGTPEQGPIDLTDATSVKFLMSPKGQEGADPPVVSDTAVIVDMVTGVVQYIWSAGDTDESGEYSAEFEITWNDGGIETVPNNSFKDITIVEDLG